MTLRLPFRALQFAKPVWAPVRGTPLHGNYTDKLQVSTQWSARRQYASSHDSDYMAYDGVHPKILDLYRAQSKAQGDVHSSGRPLSPPTNLMAFKELTDSGQATIEDALYFLASMKSELQRVGDMTMKRALSEDLQIGSSVLAWIRDVEPLTSRSLPGSLLLRFLMWHLVAEGNETLVHGWIDETAVKHSGSEHLSPIFALPAGLVGAHLKQSQSGSADAALTCYLTLKRRHSRDDQAPISFVAAASALRMWLQSPSTPPCNTDLYEQFLEDQRVRQDDEAAKQVAALHLWHPSQSSPWPFHKFTLNVINERRRRSSYSYAAWNNIGVNALRASYVIRLLGHQDAADLFEAKIVGTFRAVGKHREAIIASFCRDPKLALLRSRGEGSTVDVQASQQVQGVPFDHEQVFAARAARASRERHEREKLVENSEAKLHQDARKV